MTTTAVRIWCPEWCTVPEQTHADQLENWEGLVIHHGDPAGVTGGDVYELSCVSYPDGTLVPEDREHAPVMLIAANSELVHPDDLERHARILLDLVARARGQQKERTR